MIHRSPLPQSIIHTLFGLGLSTATLCAQAATVMTIEGNRVQGTILGLQVGEEPGNARVKLHTETNEERLIPLDMLESITIENAVPYEPKSTRDQRVWLRSGPVLSAKFKSGEAMKVVLRVAGMRGTSIFPIPNLSALQFQDDLRDDGGFRRAIAKPSATQDLVFLWNRARSKIIRLPTQILGVGPEGFEITFRDREQKVPASQIYGIVFGTENGIEATVTSFPAATVQLKNGPALTGNLIGWDQDNCRLRLAEGAILDLATRNIASVRIRSSRVRYLSALEPSRVEQVPAFDRTRAWLRDQSPRGPGLELGGTKYRRGLCLIPRTILDYQLDGKFDVFEATVGIDDRSSRQAHALIRIKADGKIVFEAEPFTLGTTPKVVRIPLAGIKTLTLETDFGQNFDLGDHCVFAGARLLKN